MGIVGSFGCMYEYSSCDVVSLPCLFSYHHHDLSCNYEHEHDDAHDIQHKHL